MIVAQGPERISKAFNLTFFQMTLYRQRRNGVIAHGTSPHAAYGRDHNAKAALPHRASEHELIEIIQIAVEMSSGATNSHSLLAIDDMIETRPPSLAN
jgi:hypothetical protein